MSAKYRADNLHIATAATTATAFLNAGGGTEAENTKARADLVAGQQMDARLAAFVKCENDLVELASGAPSSHHLLPSYRSSSSSHSERDFLLQKAAVKQLMDEQAARDAHKASSDAAAAAAAASVDTEKKKLKLLKEKMKKAKERTRSRRSRSSSSSPDDSSSSEESDSDDDDLASYGGQFRAASSSASNEKKSKFIQRFMPVLKNSNEKARFTMSCQPIPFKGSSMAEYEQWSDSTIALLTSHGVSSIMLLYPLPGTAHNLLTTTAGYDPENPLVNCPAEDMELIKDHMKKWDRLRDIVITVGGFITQSLKNPNDQSRNARIPRDNLCQMWKTLRLTYLTGTDDDIQLYLSKLSGIKQLAGQSVADFGEQILKIAGTLNKLGHTVPLIAQRERLFSGIRKGYRTEVDRKDETTKDESLEDTVKRLTSLEMSIRRENEREGSTGESFSNEMTPGEHHSAAAAVTRTSSGAPRECWYCGKTHVFDRKTNPCKGTPQSCKYPGCGGKGHGEEQCFIKFPKLKEEAIARAAARGNTSGRPRPAGGLIAIVGSTSAAPVDRTRSSVLAATSDIMFALAGSESPTSTSASESTPTVLTGTESAPLTISVVFDSGATVSCFMPVALPLLLHRSEYKKTLTTATGSTISGGVIGGVAVRQGEHGATKQFDNIVISDKLGYNLLSLSQLEDQFGATMEIKNGTMTITTGDGQVWLKANRTRGLYIATITLEPIPSIDVVLPRVQPSNHPDHMLSTIEDIGYYASALKTNPEKSPARAGGEASIDAGEQILERNKKRKIEEQQKATAAGTHGTAAFDAMIKQLDVGITRATHRLSVMDESRLVTQLVATSEDHQLARLSSASSSSSQSRLSQGFIEDRYNINNNRCTAFAVVKTNKQCEIEFKIGEYCNDHLASVCGLRIDELQGGKYVLYTTTERRGPTTGPNHSILALEVIGFITGRYWSRDVDASSDCEREIYGEDGSRVNSSMAQHTFSVGVHRGRRFYITSAHPKNSVLKFIAHSDAPNCVLQRSFDGRGMPHIAVVTAKKIAAGTALTANLTIAHIKKEEGGSKYNDSTALDEDDGPPIPASDDEEEQEAPIVKSTKSKKPSTSAAASSSSSSSSSAPQQIQGDYMLALSVGSPQQSKASKASAGFISPIVYHKNGVTSTTPASSAKVDHKKLFCTQCKDKGHLVNECYLRPPMMPLKNPAASSSSSSSAPASVMMTNSFRPVIKDVSPEERAHDTREALRQQQIKIYLYPWDKVIQGRRIPSGQDGAGTVVVSNLKCVHIQRRRGWADEERPMLFNESEANCNNDAVWGALCIDHLDLLDGLAVERSSIPYAGMGLILTKDRAAGYIVGPYTGRAVPRITKANEKLSAYMIDYSETETESMLDASHSNTNVTRFINDGCYPQYNNCRFAYRNGSLVVILTKDCKAGVELKICYGINYWPSPVDHSDQDSMLQTEAQQNLYNVAAASSSSSSSSSPMPGAMTRTKRVGEKKQAPNHFFYYGQFTPKTGCYPPANHTYFKEDGSLGPEIALDDPRMKMRPGHWLIAEPRTVVKKGAASSSSSSAPSSSSSSTPAKHSGDVVDLTDMTDSPASSSSSSSSIPLPRRVPIVVKKANLSPPLASRPPRMTVTVTEISHDGPAPMDETSDNEQQVAASINIGRGPQIQFVHGADGGMVDIIYPDIEQQSRSVSVSPVDPTFASYNNTAAAAAATAENNNEEQAPNEDDDEELEIEQGEGSEDTE